MAKVQTQPLDQLMSSAKDSAETLKVLSHHLRLLSVCYIGNGEKSVQELADHLKTSQSNMSQHLAKLRASGILECRKEANQVYYRIKDNRTMDLVSALQTIYCEEPTK
jgi:DNA-binding transcriptional ArsR family regulator